jgi:protocatechuate 3,4-dioxygenase beta subunit
MRTQSLFLALVVCLLLGVTASSGQIRAQVPGSSDPEREDRELGAIQGAVLAADGGSPLAKATVSLRKSGSRGGGSQRTARTDARGEYEFRDLEAGKYQLSVMRNGYLPQNYGQKRVQAFRGRPSGTPLTLGDGRVLDGIDFNLIRGGVVEGRVADQDYEPLSRVAVTLSGYQTVQGERTLVPVARAQTDDRGQFRLFDIPPGSYFLSATRGGAFPFFRGGGRRRQSFPPTYYPGVPSLEQATKVEVSAGGEVGGFHLTLIESHTYSVSGRVLAADGSPAQSVRIITVNQSGPAVASFRGGGTTTDLQGAFKVAGLLPGKHRLIAFRGRREEPQIASALVEVIERDIQGLTLALGSGASITGRIVSENEEPALDWRRISVETRPAEGGRRGRVFGGRGARVEEDLSFRISNLPGGLYRFSVSLPPGNHYVESIRAEGQDIFDRLLELNDHDHLSEVEVRVSPEGSQISGMVESEEDGQPVDGATVLVFAADPQQRGSVSRFTRTTQTDQAGRFSLQGLAPAEYLVCALVEHEPGRESEPEYLNGLEGDSTTIDLSAGEMSSKTLVALQAPATN